MTHSPKEYTPGGMNNLKSLFMPAIGKSTRENTISQGQAKVLSVSILTLISRNSESLMLSMVLSRLKQSRLKQSLAFQLMSRLLIAHLVYPFAVIDALSFHQNLELLITPFLIPLSNHARSPLVWVGPGEALWGSLRRKRF